MSYRKTTKNIEAVINRVCLELKRSKATNTSGEKLKHLSGLINSWCRVRTEASAPSGAPEQPFYETLEADAELYDEFGVLKDNKFTQEDSE